MMGNYYDNMMGGFGFSWIFMIVFLGVLIWLIFVLAYGMSGRDTKQNKNNALDILKERYAKGEISKEEFEKKKKDLLS